MEPPPVMDVDIDTEENRILMQAIQQSGLADVFAETPSAPLQQQLENLDAEMVSRDGADSGIDVKLESPFPKPPATAEHRVKSTQNIQLMTSRVAGYKPKSPCFHPDQNYKRWISPQSTRQLDPGTQQRLMRMATVSARRRPSSLFSDDPLRLPGKLITWHEATQSRPPLRIDMSGPSPTTYSPRNKPLYETNAPAYSFGRKEAEKEGSGQKAWSKLWFRSHSPFTHKTNYELRWPTAPHYQQKSMLGPKQACRPGFPSHSIGVRNNLQLVAKSKEEMPASNQYEPELAQRHVTRRAPAFSMGCKLPNKIWVKTLNVPAPNCYNPKSSIRSVRPTHPAFTMCVERRFKRHDIGPFATL